MKVENLALLVDNVKIVNVESRQYQHLNGTIGKILGYSGEKER